MGPADTSMTVTFKLKTEFQLTTEAVSSGLKNIKQSSQNLVKQSDSVLSSLKSGKSQFGDFQSSVKDYDNTASDNTDTVNFRIFF